MPDVGRYDHAVRPVIDVLGRAADQRRLHHHARLGVVATPTIQQVAHTRRRLTLLNRHQVSARRGLIVTGPAGTGKTTAITQLGRSHERATARLHQDSDKRIPVVYATVPPVATPRMLAVEFAQLLGLPINTMWNQADGLRGLPVEHLPEQQLLGRADLLDGSRSSRHRHHGRPEADVQRCRKNAGACNGESITATYNSGTAVPLGNISSATPQAGGQDLSVSTNTANGFNVYARSTGASAMSDGTGIQSMTLPELTPRLARSVCWSKGFGYTTDDSTLSGTANRFTNGGPKLAAFTISNAETVYFIDTGGGEPARRLQDRRRRQNLLDNCDFHRCSHVLMWNGLSDPSRRAECDGKVARLQFVM